MSDTGIKEQLAVGVNKISLRNRVIRAAKGFFRLAAVAVDNGLNLVNAGQAALFYTVPDIYKAQTAGLTVFERYCASSDNLGQLSGFPFGGPGSSLIEFMRFQFDGASAV